MKEPITRPVSLTRNELEAVYAISQAVAGAIDLEQVLEKIIRIARSVFIFDNFALYELSSDESLEIGYVRAIGRGRHLQEELVWGESIALSAFKNRRTITQMEDLTESNDDRTSVRYFLALPLVHGEKYKGALVFIRFGSPPFLPDQVRLAEYISENIAQLLEHKQLVERIAGLEAKRRLDSLQDDFIAMISHDLLTPLGYIKGYSTTLLRQDIEWDQDQKREFLEIIRDESDHLRELIESLMDSSRLQTGRIQMNFQSVSINSLVYDSCQRVKSLDGDIQVSVHDSGSNETIEADPARITQVIDNILINAVKYAPESEVEIILKSEDQTMLISIEDNGPGIEADYINQIFDRFYRVPDVRNKTIRGTGLGLYICKKIIDAHHGQIAATSAPGEGTRFTISIPRRQNENVQEIGS